MAATEKYLRLIIYAPALSGDDGRPLAIVHGMERSVPGLRLEWTTSENEDLIALPRRDEWVVSNTTGNKFPFLCNEDENRLVTLTGWENARGLAADMTPHFEAHATLPQDEGGIAAAVDALEAVAEGARALWGHLSPDRVMLDVADQIGPKSHGSAKPPRGLPVLKFSQYIPAQEIPHYLGWLNYWSAAAARAIGFPDPARDAELLSQARRTATGGWVVQLTPQPLDLENPAHLQALLRAYERFPVIGGRAEP